MDTKQTGGRKQERKVENNEELNKGDGNQRKQRKTQEEGIRNVRRKVRNGEEAELKGAKENRMDRQKSKLRKKKRKADKSK